MPREGIVETPSPTEEIANFPQRLKLAMSKRSARAFAMQCGMSSTVIHQYLAGKSEPTRLALIAMAQVSGVNLEWLMSEEGPMKKIKGAVLVDRELYDGIIGEVEEYLMKNGQTLPPEKKLEVYHYLYDLFREMPGLDREQVEKTLRLVV